MLAHPRLRINSGNIRDSKIELEDQIGGWQSAGCRQLRTGTVGAC